VDPFEAHVRATLAYYGVEVDDTDVAVMQVAEATYGPDLRALQAADLADVWVEPDLDPSRAPSA
jgi:hypothetical protein